MNTLNNEILNKGMKYIAWGFVAFILLRYLPKEPLQTNDAFLFSAIAILSYIVLDNMVSLYLPTLAQSANCNTSCVRPEAKKEGMETVTPPVVPEYQKRTNESQIEKTGSRQSEDIIVDESKYTDFNTLPVGLNESKNTFEYGYSFLPPKDWYPVPPHPPVCVTEKQCPVCPVFTQGTPVDVKEWDQSRRIMPPDTINVAYIKDKLNSGR